MTDRDALLAAIMESPADDTPRLIYADWLEDHGQYRLATFIRSPNQWCQSDSGVGQFCPYAAFRDRAVRFCPTCEVFLLSGVPQQFLGEGRYTARHGFLGSVRCSWNDWRIGERRLLRRQPIQRVQITTVPEVTVMPEPAQRLMVFFLVGCDAHIALTYEFIDQHRLRGDAMREHVTRELLRVRGPALRSSLSAEQANRRDTITSCRRRTP